MSKSRIRIAYITDVHLRINPPSRRIDNYLENILEKIKEVVHLCNEQKTDYLLIGGDFYDSPSPPPSLVSRVVDILSGLKSTEVYAILGNHEMVGHQVASVEDKMIGMLSRFPNDYPIKLIGNSLEEPVIILKGGIPLWAAHYHDGIEKKLKEKFSEGTPEMGLFMVHANIVDSPAVFEDHILMSEFKPPVNIVLCSHYHTAFGLIKKPGGYAFVSPGALSRVNISISDIKRKPSVAFIELGDTIKLEIKPLTSAKPVEDIFDLESISKEKQDRDILKDFIDSITLPDSDYSYFDVSRLIMSMEDIPQEIKEEAIRALEEVRGGA